MTLLSLQLFDHCTQDNLDTNPTIENIETTEVQQFNPCSGLPLIQNSGVDICGYAVGDGHNCSDDDDALNTEVLLDECGHFSVDIDTHSFDESTTEHFCDDFSIDDGFSSFDDFSM